MNKQRLLELAILRMGVKSQINKAKEELSELHLELDRLAYDPKRTSTQKIIEEIADVQIVCEQLALIYGKANVEREKLYKLDRLLDRMMDKKLLTEQDLKEIKE